MSKILSTSLSLLFLIAISSCGLNFSPGSGEKVGQVVEIRKQGVLCRGWAAQIIFGKIKEKGGAFGVQPFEFIVQTEELAQKVEGYVQDQAKVVIQYRMGAIDRLFCGSEEPILVSIEPQKK